MITALSGVVLVAMGTQLFKALVEAFGLTPEVKMHDPLIWLFAFGSGIAGYIADAAIHTTLTPIVAETAAGDGVLAAFSALGVYHLVAHPFFDSTPTLLAGTAAPLNTLFMGPDNGPPAGSLSPAVRPLSPHDLPPGVSITLPGIPPGGTGTTGLVSITPAPEPITGGAV